MHLAAVLMIDIKLDVALNLKMLKERSLALTWFG